MTAVFATAATIAAIAAISLSVWGLVFPPVEFEDDPVEHPEPSDDRWGDHSAQEDRK